MARLCRDLVGGLVPDEGLGIVVCDLRCNNDGVVPRWSDFVDQERDFAERVQSLFGAHKHHTMATLRRDGSPRISGTEVAFEDGDLILGMMPAARRALDLRRDSRLAIHSHSVDPPDDPSAWCGEAKISGTGVEMGAIQDVGNPHRFRVEVAEVVVTQIGVPADHLVIESWRSGQGIRRIERR